MGFGDVGTTGSLGASIAHAVVEDHFITQDAEGDVEQAIINGGTDTLGTEDGTLANLSALEAVVAHVDIGRWVGQFAHLEGDGGHGQRFAFVYARHGERDILTYMGWTGHIAACAL